MTNLFFSQIRSTYKSLDTEEWLDTHFTRPLGYLWARLFMSLNIHPNTVTILSIFLGIAAGIMFVYQDLLHNIIGVLLLIWANIYDSCDGQLARMTGKKTRWGRILDGFAGDVWFFFIYLAIIIRLFEQPIPFTHISWGIIGVLMCLLAGSFFHARQCQLSDYYRNIHLYFLPDTTSELDTSSQQRQLLSDTPKKGNFWWRLFLKSYVKYTSTQERLTPSFQALMTYFRQERQGHIPNSFRQHFRQQSLPLMKYANIVTFNCRAITLYVACLTDLPWLYPVMEITVFTGIASYMHHRHESMCSRFLIALRQGKYSA